MVSILRYKHFPTYSSHRKGERKIMQNVDPKENKHQNMDYSLANVLLIRN
jgi:hypothetical protein